MKFIKKMYLIKVINFIMLMNLINVVDIIHFCNEFQKYHKLYAVKTTIVCSIKSLYYRRNIDHFFSKKQTKYRPLLLKI